MKLFSARRFLSKASQKGFTLIELLVVIGILGILAAALVATIDPFEQLNKARDARVENTLVEFQNGLLRYYTIQGVMPWSPQSTDLCNGQVIPDATPLATGSPITPSDCVQALIDQGELKDSFANSPDLAEIYITEDTVTNEIVSCYEPTSRSKQRDPNTIYNNDGTDNSGVCPDPDAAAGTCYWCTR